jgi:hypothetical protein
MHELEGQSSCKNSKTFEVSEFIDLDVSNTFLNHIIYDAIFGTHS